MNKRRKLLSLLLCFALVFTMIPATAFAADGQANVSYAISDTEVLVGETFTVTMSHSDMSVSSFACGVRFDVEKLKVVSVKSTDPNFPDDIALEKVEGGRNPYVDLTASTPEEANGGGADDLGRVGFVLTGTADVAFKGMAFSVITFEALETGTAEFELYEKSAGADGWGDVDNNFTIRTDSVTIVPAPTPFEGSVTISGKAAYGETLTAVVTDANNTMNGDAQYQWYYVDGETKTAIDGATAQTYVLDADDIGKTLAVSVKGAYNHADTAATSAAFGPVTKAERTETPTSSYVNEAAVTPDIIVAVGMAGAVDAPVEMSLDQANWQTARTFGNLDANTEYTVYFRYAETDTHKASDVYTVTTRTLKNIQKITASADTFGVKYGHTLKLNEIFSSNAPGAAITYTLSEGAEAALADNIVTVVNDKDSVGKSFTVTANSAAVGEGKDAYDAAAPKSITVTILDKEFAEFNAMEAIDLMKGESVDNAASLKFGDANAFEYASDNTAVATVDAATGKVVAVGKGEATITVSAKETAEFHAASTSYKVTVYEEIVLTDTLGITAPVKYATAETKAAAGTGYGEADIEWSNALAEGKFKAGTDYDATVELKAEQYYKFDNGETTKEVTVDFPATASPDQLAGTVTIKPDAANVFGQYEFNDTLTADISGLIYGAEARFEPQNSLSYQWLRNGEEISGAASATYQLVKEDIGKMISVVVESDYNEGTVTSDAVGPVSKATNLTSAVYHVETTSSSITIIAEDCGYELEYTIDEGKTWRDANQFTGLRPNRQYFVGARCKETETHKAGPATISSNVKTDPLPQIITATQGTDLEIKYGRTIRLHDYFKSNAMGSYLTFKVTRDGDEVEIENKSLDLGDQIGVTYTIVASSGAFGEYAAADDVTITITVVPKTTVVFDSDFETPMEALKTDANITNKVATVITEGYDGSIEYSSSNSDVAAVNRETGEVDIIGPGEATITATALATDEFEIATSAYTLTVYDIVDVTNIAITAPVKYAEPQTSVEDGAGYAGGKITWSVDGETFTGSKFGRETVYTAAVTLTAKDGFKFADGKNTYTYTHTFPATAGFDPLGGTAAITGTPVFGQTLTADITGLNYGAEEQGEITYQWYRDGEAIEGATGAEYELVKEDIGAYIDVRVKNSLNTGSVENEGDFGPVQKAAAKETVKAEVTATADTITVTNVTEGQVYSIDGQNWNAEGVFTGLEAYTEYTVYTKVAETDVTEEGSVETTAIRTLKLAQVITAEQDEVTVKFGKTFDIKTIVKSNAEGAQLVITAEGTMPEGTTFENGVVKAGTAEGEFTVKVNSAAVGKYYDAEEVTITVKIAAKDAQVFESGFTGRIVKTYGDSKFGRTAVLKTGNGKITYTSTNPGVATVDAAGGVTIIGAGETVITATAAETEDFAKASASYTVVVNKKQLAVPTLSGTYTYNGADQTAAITGFDEDAMVVIGNVAKNAGTYSVVVTLMDTANFEWVDGTSEAKSLVWSIAKATVTGKPEFTKITKKDKTLADAPITVGTITVEGTVAWDDPAETVVEKNKYYGWTFTPEDAANYEVLKGEFKVYSGYSGGGSGGGGGFFIPKEPIFELGEGVTLDLSVDGTHAKFIVAEGYEIVDVTLNGHSRGPVSEMKFLEDGDKVAVITKKLATEEEVTEETIKAELIKVKLVARSKVVTMKSGKPAIRLNWFDKYGHEIDYDGYQIFRSIKRYKGYGKKPLYTTMKTTYFNTAIKPQVMYYYKVRGFIEFNGKKIYTEWSDKAWRKVGLDKFK